MLNLQTLSQKYKTLSQFQNPRKITDAEGCGGAEDNVCTGHRRRYCNESSCINAISRNEKRKAEAAEDLGSFTHTRYPNAPFGRVLVHTLHTYTNAPFGRVLVHTLHTYTNARFARVHVHTLHTHPKYPIYLPKYR